MSIDSLNSIYYQQPVKFGTYTQGYNGQSGVNSQINFPKEAHKYEPKTFSPSADQYELAQAWIDKGYGVSNPFEVQEPTNLNRTKFNNQGYENYSQHDRELRPVLSEDLGKKLDFDC